MTFGIGIVSLAHAHIGMYASMIQKMEDARVLAVWDDDAARGGNGAKNFGAEFVPELEAMLARKDIEAVIIGSPTAHHAGHVAAAAAAGKHILLQKPMALTLEDCDRMIAAVNQAGVRFSLAWQMRCDPQNQWMRQTVASGKLGKVTLVRRRHGLGTHLWGAAFENSWHVKPELNRGMFMDDAAHPVDWLYWMFGRPTSVTAEIHTLLNPKVPDDTGVAIFRFAGGMMGVIECSFTCVAADDTTNIYGQHGTILQRFGDAVSCTPDLFPGQPSLRYRMAGEANWTGVDIPSPANHGLRIGAVARPAVEYLMGRGEPIATAEEGRIVVELLLAAYESSWQGSRLSL